jgi:hypothetical protein
MITKTVPVSRSDGENSFRNVWTNVRKDTVSTYEQIAHLKCALGAWVRTTHAAHIGSLTPGEPVPAHPAAEALCSQLEPLVTDAVHGNWSVERLVSSICVAALSDAGLQL